MAARSRLRSAVAFLVVLVVAGTVIDAGPPDDPEQTAGPEPGGQTVQPAGPPPNAATVSTWERKPDDPPILNAGTSNAVPGEFLVALKGEVPWSETEARSRRLVEKYGAELLTVLQILPGFGMRATDEQARRMAADPAVDVVEQNQRGKPRGRQRDTQITDLPWHLDRDDQRPTTLDGKYHHGFSNVPIYIVDSGVFLAHEEFENRAAFEYNATTGGNGDCIGHGTKVASAAAGRTLGVSKKSPIRSVKVWDCTAGTTEMWMADGLNWVALTASRPAVANLSMGDTGPRSLLNNAAKGLVAAGITLVIAGDNADDDSCNYSPELIGPEVAGAISVAGIEEGDLRWYDGPGDGSNYGPCLEIFAPAYDITLADNNGISLYTDDSGNSFAAPQVAGAAALILAQHPNYSPAQVEAALIADSTKDAVTDPKGTPNRLLYVAPPDQPGTAVSNSNLNALFNAYGDQGGHWTGGDETMSVELPDGRVAWFFGDTMLGTVNADGSRPRDTPMIHNSVVIQDGDTLTSTLHGGTAAQPKSFVSTGDDDYDGHFGWWPGEARVTGNELQVFYHHVVNSHEGGPFPFKIDEIGIATFSLPSMTYQGMTHLTGLGTSSNRQIAWGAAMTDGVGTDGFTYIYGRENAKDFRHLYVARAPKGQLKNLSAWRFWTGSTTVAQQWSANERDAVSTMTGVSASFSVKYLPQYRSYVLVTFDESLAFGNRIFAYHAESPTGPFRHGTLLYQAPEAGGGRYTYNARLHLEQDAGGATAVVSYNVNSFDWDAVYRDARLYRPRFINVTLPPPPNGSLLPDAPRDLTAVSPADGQVKLDWTAALQPNLRYWVYERQVSLDPVSGKDIGATQFIRKPNPVTGTTTTFGVLSQGIYEYRVAAANASGEGPPSLPARVAVRLPKPAIAPANLTAAANPDGSVALSWQPVTAAGLVNYRVYQRNVTDNTSFLEASSVAVTGTTARVSGLTSGKTYEFYVVAFNGTGEGPRSNTARATPTAPPPPAPTGLTATPNGDGTITLSWNPAGAGFWYWIEMRKVGEATFTRLQYPVSTGTTHTVSYLDNRQAYEFRVVSISTNGAESGPSAAARATSQYAAPPVPTGLTATANSDGTIALAWKSSGPGIWYWIEMRKVGEATFGRLQYPVSTGTTHTVSLLQNGQAYEFRIVALGPGEAESAPSNVARATSTIPPPGAPTNLRATAGNGQVSLTWTAPGSGLLYWVYWRPVGQANYNRLQNPASATSATVLPLNNGTTYEFRVTAVGSGGSESAPSNVVQARPSMPLPGAPTGLTATANADGSIRLSWNAPGTSLFYWIYMRDVTLGGAIRRLDLPVNDRTTHTLTGLTLNSRYEFYVTAENQGGEGPPSNTAQATSTLPAPTGLVAWWEDNHAIYLSWNGDPNAYHYLYIRDVAAGGGFIRQNLPVHGRTWHIARPLTSTAYEFYVTRAGNGGETARTNIASVGAQYPTPSAGNLAVSMQTSPPRCVQAYQSPIWSCSSTVSTTATLSSWDRNFRVDHKLNIEWRFTGGVEGVATGICWPTQTGVPQAGCVMTIQRTVYWTLWSVGTPTNTSGPDVCIDTIAHAYYVLDAHNNTVQRRRTYWACVQPGPGA